MNKPRVRVVNPKDGWLGTEYYINEQKINNVKGVDFHVAVDEIPEFTFETFGLPDIDMSGTVSFGFTPQTVQEAAIVLQNEFKTNSNSFKSLVSSIQSALDETEGEELISEAAKRIAKRIVGSDN